MPKRKVIKYVDPAKITPDPNNPRTTFSEEQVEGMAASLLTEGMINPIEIDSDNVIVTGEIRWRGAIQAGMKSIPTTLCNPSTPAHRLLRQLVENLHQGSLPGTHLGMTPWDTGKAFDKLLSVKGKSLFAPGANNGRRVTPQGYSALADYLGCSEVYVREHVSLVQGSGHLQKVAEEGRLSSTAIPRAVQSAPKEYQEAFSKAIYDTVRANTGVVRQVALALTYRAKNKEAAQAIIDVVMSAKDLKAAKRQISKAVPTIDEALGRSRRHGDDIVKAIDNLTGALRVTKHMTTLSKGMQMMVWSAVLCIQQTLSDFIRTDESPSELDDPPELDDPDVIEGEFKEV